MATADNPEEIEVVTYIDNDDGHYDDLELPRLTKLRGERIVLSQMWNECWKAAQGEVYGHMGDDIIFRTQGWDTAIKDAINQYEDKIVFAFGNDGSPGGEMRTFGTHGFVHRNWTDTLGRFVPPYFSSDYNDTWFNDVAKMIGRHCYVNIYTEHMHYSMGKAEIDDNTRERLARHASDNVEHIYESKKPEREQDAEKLKKFIEGHQNGS
jgi:hypothetical protein